MKNLIDKLSEQQSKQLLLKLCEYGWSDSIPDDIVEYCESEYKIDEEQKEEVKNTITIPKISNSMPFDVVEYCELIVDPFNEFTPLNTDVELDNKGFDISLDINDKFKVTNIAEDFTADIRHYIKKNAKDGERAHLLAMLDCCDKTITTGYLHYIDQKVSNSDVNYYIEYIVKPCRNDNGELIEAADHILEKSREDFDKLFNYLSEL